MYKLESWHVALIYDLLIKGARIKFADRDDSVGMNSRKEACIATLVFV
jgi:hypothetical protein